MQKARQEWSFVDFGQKKVWPRQSRWGAGLGGGDATDCAGVGFGASRAGGFLPLEAAGGCKTVAGAYFTLDPKGDEYHAF